MIRITLTFCLCLLTAVSSVIFVDAAIADDESLTLGVFPRRNAKVTYKLFKPMAAYLSEQLNREVKLVTAKADIR